MVDRSARQGGLRGPAIVGVLAVAVGALLYFRDPREPGSYGFCPFQALTSAPCPGCGGLRAVNHLTHGRFVEAVSSNALAVVLVVGFIIAWIIWVVRRVGTGRNVAILDPSPRVIWCALAIVLIFWVLRNTPFGSWFAP